MTAVLLRVWAGPWSLVGLILALFFRRRRIFRGVVLAEGADWPRRLGWRYRAITFGHVILVVDEADERIMAHEFVHVHQYEIWGPLMVPVYGVVAAWTVARGKHFYRDNPFEVAARAAEPEA